MRRILLGLLFAALAGTALPARAAVREVPYWASIRAKVMNARRGPAHGYPIAWVYRRQQLPLKVIRLKEGWRLVQDQDGDTGWVLAQFLSPDRTAVVTGKGLTQMRAEATPEARLLWQVEPGVVGKLGDCEGGWCRLDTGAGHVGYLPQDRLWARATREPASAPCEGGQHGYLASGSSLTAFPLSLVLTKLRSTARRPLVQQVGAVLPEGSKHILPPPAIFTDPVIGVPCFGTSR